MSSGLVICSICHREVHQNGPAFDQSMTGVRTRAWLHCEDKSRMCDTATAMYPTSDAQIVGKWCGADRTTDDLPLEKTSRQQRRAKERKRR